MKKEEFERLDQAVEKLRELTKDLRTSGNPDNILEGLSDDDIILLFQEWTVNAKIILSWFKSEISRLTPYQKLYYLRSLEYVFKSGNKFSTFARILQIQKPRFERLDLTRAVISVTKEIMDICKNTPIPGRGWAECIFSEVYGENSEVKTVILSDGSKREIRSIDGLLYVTNPGYPSARGKSDMDDEASLVLAVLKENGE